MPWNDSSETVVGGTGEVYVGPVGTALPAAEDSALNAAFGGTGFLSEDGISTNQSTEVIRHRAWQTKHNIRIDRDAETFQLSFVAQQFNEITVPLAFGGGDVADLGSGSYKYTPPAAGDSVDERAIVADVIDGDDILRFVVPRGMAVEAVNSQFTRTALGQLPVTIEALQPEDGGFAWYILTNLVGFATGS